MGTKTLCLFLEFSNFLRASFSFSVQNLTQQRYNFFTRKTVEIVRENWEVAYFYRENKPAFFMLKSISVFGVIVVQVGRRRA